jgi:glycosyltransferase involved in cell wall biosynthesis
MRRGKIRLAFISTIQTVGWGGSEELWALAAGQALAGGNEVGIFVYEWLPMPPRLRALQDKGARIFYRKRHYRRKRLLDLFGRIAGGAPGRDWFPSFSALKKFDPDVVCITDAATWFSLTMTDLLTTLRQLRKPYVLISQANGTFHLPPERETARQFFHDAFCVAFVSEHNRLLAEHQLASGIPNAVVLQNPVNLNDLSPVPWPATADLTSEVTDLSFAGRTPTTAGPARLAMVARLVASEKGQDILFRILSRPEWQRRDYRLTLYGEGPDKNYLLRLAEYYKIPDKLRFAGHVRDVRTIWAENELNVLPTHIEGTPLSLLESMVCGRPSVVTDEGGNAEWLTEGVTGFIAGSATEKLFGEALEKAWQHRDQWQQMGAKAHADALQKLDRSPGSSLLAILLDATTKP